MSSRIAQLGADPVAMAYRVAGKALPAALWGQLGRRGRALGLSGAVFLLSLDCDTDLDIEVVRGVHKRLGDIGLTPAYAVPGELLERGADVYGELAAAGAEFINHGWVQHTHVDPGRTRYESTFFYDQVGWDAALEDVHRGHEAVLRVLGRTPAGFRTPHFGTFQRPEQLRRLHGVLEELGYRFSSSTVPLHAYRHGPLDRRHGLPELPVSGCPDWPLSVLDTWGFRFAPGRRVGERDFLRQCAKLAGLCERGAPLVVNVYGDPSQVHDWPEFYEALSRFAPFAVSSFAGLLDRVGA